MVQHLEARRSPLKGGPCLDERIPKSISRAFNFRIERRPEAGLLCQLSRRQNDLSLRTRRQKFMRLARLF